MENPQELKLQKQQLDQTVLRARSNLLLAMILTAVNILMLFVGGDYFLLFSITAPYYAAGILYYMGDPAVGLVFAGALLALYVLCWWLSKKKPGWLAVALALFLVDTACLLWLEGLEGILNLLIHIWLLFYLFTGTRAAGKLKKLPPVPEELLVERDLSDERSTPLRIADPHVKCKILLETGYAGHKICYRRIKKTEELVVDGYVYDEYVGLPGLNHSMRAVIGGRHYEIGYANSRNFFLVDGEIIVNKIRW